MKTPGVKYQPSTPIDTAKILVIEGLSDTDDQWRPIESAYPELEGKSARLGIRTARTVIHPPREGTARGLWRTLVLYRRGAKIAELASGEVIVRKPDGPDGVIVHIYR